MKFFWPISKILAAAALPLIFLTLSVSIAFNSQWFYSYGFDKYDISAVTGLEEDELEKASRQLIAYFNSNEELIYIELSKNGEAFELFNEREIHHLNDVKDLVGLCYNVLLFASLYISGFTAVFLARKPREWPGIARVYVLGSLLTLAIIATLGIVALIDFRWLFWQFHLVSFANDLWLLDPSTDYLIMMFPQGFWFDATILVAVLTSAWALLAGGCSYALLGLKKDGD